MLVSIHLGQWDIILLVVVSFQATLLAYLPEPKVKALLFSLPIPFTLAALALGKPVNTFNVVGLLLLLLFTQGVRLLRVRWGVPIIASILINALVYCILAKALIAVLPATAGSFWVACVTILVLAIVLLRLMPHREEPGCRTPLPIWVKFPAIVGVIFFIIVIKQQLQGFVTMFPMVSLIAVYEARGCLWTICRQVPLFMLTFIPMIIVCRLLQGVLGLGWALLSSWSVFLLAMWLLGKWTRRSRVVVSNHEPGCPGSFVNKPWANPKTYKFW